MIARIIPKLPFIDKQKTLDFYMKLGFEFVIDYDQYVIVRYEDMEIHFFEHLSLKPDISDFMIYLIIDKDIEVFYTELQECNVDIHPNGALEDKDWNMTEFALIDPNGTLLTFGQKTK